MTVEPVSSAVATSVETVFPGVLRWSVYSPAHKVELTSHAVGIGDTGIVFDPIPLAAPIWDWFPPRGAPTAFVLTNENHERDLVRWQSLFPVPAWASPDANLHLPYLQRWESGPRPVCPITGWEIVPLPGGEAAWFCPELSLAVFGDAVVNLTGRGLEILPDRYCTDPARLRQSLRGLVQRRFDRALFAHGNPLERSASAQIAALL